MANIKNAPQVATTISQVANHVQKKAIPTTSGILVIGTFISTGGPFSRAFPDQNTLNQWLQSGSGADVDITRVEAVQFTS